MVKLFQNICNNPDLANYTVFFPGSNKHSLNLKNNGKFHVPICKTDRLKSFFFSSFLQKLYIGRVILLDIFGDVHFSVVKMFVFICSFI